MIRCILQGSFLKNFIYYFFHLDKSLVLESKKGWYLQNSMTLFQCKKIPHPKCGNQYLILGNFLIILKNYVYHHLNFYKNNQPLMKEKQVS